MGSGLHQSEGTESGDHAGDRRNHHGRVKGRQQRWTATGEHGTEGGRGDQAADASQGAIQTGGGPSMSGIGGAQDGIGQRPATADRPTESISAAGKIVRQ